MKLRPAILALLAAVAAAHALDTAAAAAAPEAPPAAAAVPASPLARPRDFREVLHGVEVADPYRWLEDTAAPEPQAFFRAQSDRTRDVLARIPARDGLLARIRELSAEEVAITQVALAAGKVFYLKLAARPAEAVESGSGESAA